MQQGIEGMDGKEGGLLMAETTAREATGDGWNIPSKYLPAIDEYKDLPDPQPLRTYLGASVILLATALGSGELIIWPYVTSQAGVGLLWLAFVGFSAQYFINMEVERYTLATGETAVTGFSRMWIGWGIIFILGSILPNTIPGWSTSAATIFTYLFGLSEGTVPLITTIFLLAIALSITLSPVVFNTLEKVELVLVAIIVVFLLVAIAIATDLSAWTGIVTKAPQGVANLPRYLQEIGTTTIFGAVVFAGAGGCNNLVQSNYIRDKGLGMGILMPKIVSPVTGEEEARPSLGYKFETNEENMGRWRNWWKVANQEQILTFYILGLLTLIGLSVLLYSALGIVNVPESQAGSIEFLRTEAEALAKQLGTWFEYFFYFAGFAVLFSTNVGVVDWVSRLTADSLKVTFLKTSEFWSESKIYVTVVWFMAIGGTIIVWTGVEPLVLLVLSATGGGFMMFFYSALLILLNRRFLPDPIKIRSWRLAGMVLSFLMYAAFVVYILYLLFTQGPSVFA
jgi:hypothetical protein